MKTIPEPDLKSAKILTPAQLNDIRFGVNTLPSKDAKNQQIG